MSACHERHLPGSAMDRPPLAHAYQDFVARSNGPMLILSLMVAVYFWAGLGLQHGHLIDGWGFILGRDFLNFWHYGLAAWSGDGAAHYDPHIYNARLDEMFGGHDYPDQLSSYPPHIMLLAAPFGLVGYYTALALFTVTGISLYWVFIVRTFAGSAQRLALLSMPTVAVFLVCGQFSAFLAVLFVCLYRNLDSRPLVAAVLIALLTMKPHHGLLIPLFLMLTGRWRVFGFASLFTATLLCVSVMFHGWEPWQIYLTEGVRHQSASLVSSGVLVFGLMPTAFVDIIVLGGSPQAAWTVHALFALLGAAFLIHVVRKTEDNFLRFAALIVATLIVTPYLMAYDTLLLGWVMITLSLRYRTDWVDRLSYRLVMALCPIGVILAIYGVPGAPLILALLAVWIVKSVDRASEPAETQAAPLAPA
jgi:hypothetical protein